MRWPKRAPINNVPAGRDNAGEKKKFDYGTAAIQMNVTNTTEMLCYVIAISLKKSKSAECARTYI